MWEGYVWITASQIVLDAQCVYITDIKIKKRKAIDKNNFFNWINRIIQVYVLKLKMNSYGVRYYIKENKWTQNPTKKMPVVYISLWSKIKINLQQKENKILSLSEYDDIKKYLNYQMSLWAVENLMYTGVKSVVSNLTFYLNFYWDHGIMIMIILLKNNFNYNVVYYDHGARRDVCLQMKINIDSNEFPNHDSNRVNNNDSS